MQKATLDDAKGFFWEVLKPNYDEFMNTTSSFRTAFNAVTALFHMHEWVYEFNKAEIESKFSFVFPKKGDFWGHIEVLVPNAKFIRDLVNASKHVRLTIRPSTSMTHIANTSIQSVGYGEGGYGIGRFSAPSMTMKEGSIDVYLDDCARDVFNFWNALITEIYP